MTVEPVLELAASFPLWLHGIIAILTFWLGYSLALYRYRCRNRSR